MAPLSAAPDLDWPEPVFAAVEEGRVAPDRILFGFEYPFVASAEPFGRAAFASPEFVVRFDISYLQLLPTS